MVTSMRLTRALGVVALSALVLSLAPPVAGVGTAAAGPTGSVAPGQPRDPAPPPRGVTAPLSKSADAVSSGIHQKKATLGLKRTNGTMSLQEEEGGTCWPFINWISYVGVDYDHLEEAAQIDFSSGVNCDVALDSMSGVSRIVDRSPDFNGVHFDGWDVMTPGWFWEVYSWSAWTSGSTLFSAHDENGRRLVEGVLELQLEAPAGMTWGWCFIGLCSGLGTSSLTVLLTTGVGWTGLTQTCRDQSAPLNDAELARVSRPKPGTTVWASSFLARSVPAIADEVMKFKRQLCLTSPQDAEYFATIEGKALWDVAVREAIRNTADGDDRPLYWARIHMLAALRQWRPVVDTTNAERGLDRASRGMTSHSFSVTSAKKAFISGFDPFDLDSVFDGAAAIMRSNPSAAAVLRLDGEKIGTAEVQAVIFPVRYADFTAGLVEQVVDDHLIAGPQQATIINTVSQGGSRFDLEVYNGRRRSADVDFNGFVTMDNQNQFSGPNGTAGGTYFVPIIPPGAPGLTGAPEFIASSLPTIPLCSQCPYDLVRNTRVVEQSPPGNVSAPNSTGPTPGSWAVEGSGGGFLSNELPYRATLQRLFLGSSVPAGHVHTPALSVRDDDQRIVDKRFDIAGQYKQILTALLNEPPDTTPSSLGISFMPDGAAGQCGNPGQQWATMPDWTNPVRFDTDSRTGGCQLAFGINDPRRVVAGLVLTYSWRVSPGGDARQCGNQGDYNVPITSFRYFRSPIRVDSDDKAGWCDLTFTMSGRSDYALDIKFWPDGNAGQCLNSLPQGEFRTVQPGQPVTIGINTDNRPGGCQFSLRLRQISTG